MTGEELILHFHEFNGQSVTIDQLKEFHRQVQTYVDSIGHGPYVPQLQEIRSRVAKAINYLNSRKLSSIDRVEIAAAKPEPKMENLGKEAKISHRLNGKETSKQRKKVAKVLHEFTEKKLKTHGRVVTERDQAVAIAMHEANIPKPVHGLSGIVDANALSGIAFKEFTLTDPYRTDLHKLNSDTQVMIWGIPGSGKTVYLLKFAQYLAAQLGLNTLYGANEEFGRSTFAQKIKEFTIGSDKLRFVKNVTDEMIDQFDAVFFDSINSMGMTLDDYRKLRDKHPNKLFVLIVQSTKDGDFRGGKDWEHEVDIAGEIVNRKLILRKNRLDPENSKKAEKLLTNELISEKKKKAEITQAVKDQLNAETKTTTEPTLTNQAA